MRNEKYAIFAHIYGRIAKIAAQLSNGLVNSAMGQIPCSTERISSCKNFPKIHTFRSVKKSWGNFEWSVPLIWRIFQLILILLSNLLPYGDGHFQNFTCI